MRTCSLTTSRLCHLQPGRRLSIQLKLKMHARRLPPGIDVLICSEPYFEFDCSRNRLAGGGGTGVPDHSTVVQVVADWLRAEFLDVACS